MAGKSQVARRLAMMLTLLLLPPLLTRPLVGSAQMLSWEPPLTASEMAAGPIKEPLLPPPPLQPTVQHVQRQASSMCASRPWLPDGQELGAFAMPESYVELSTVSAETLVKCRLVTANKHALLHPAANPVALVNPLWLMTPSRFDLLAKYVYARDRRLGRRSKWGLRLYLSHIGVWNGFEEHDPPQPRKSGPVAFLLAFDRLIDGQRTNSQSGAAIASTLVPLALDNSAVSSPASDMHGASRQPFGNAQRTVSGGAGVRGGVAIVDGAHRLAAAAVFGVPLLTVRVGGPPAADYGAEFFRQRGMPRSYLDAMALTWAQLHRHAARVVLLWPTLSRSPSALNTSLQELRARGQLVYVRRLDGADSPWGGSISDGRADAHPEGSGGASSDGALLLLRTLYGSEEWLGSSADGFAGARAKAARCFGKQPGGALHVIVYAAHAQKQLPPLHQQQNRDSSSSASVRRAAEAEGGVSWATRQAKEAVRRLPAVLQTGGGTGQDAVHASDTARETESLLALLLTEPGRQLLRNLRTKGAFDNFDEWWSACQGIATRVKKWAKQHRLSLEDVVIDGGTVMQTFGLRGSGDVDLIVGGTAAVTATADVCREVAATYECAVAVVRGWVERGGFGSHSHYLSREDGEDLIYNPQRHFTLFGVKMMALDEVQRLKLQRNENDFAKDILDAAMIDQLLR